MLSRAKSMSPILTGWVAILAGAAILLSATSTRAGEPFPRDHVLLPYAPAAMAEGPAALRFNPAALSASRGYGISYYHSHSDLSFDGDDALFLSTENLGFSAEWLGSELNATEGHAYTIGLATGNGSPFMVGTSYQWRSSDDPQQDKSHFWSHSLLWRPNRWLSLAAVADNYNRMKLSDGSRSDAEFTYSAAVNLLDNRLQIGGDWVQLTSQRVKDGTYRLAAAFELTDGVTLYGDIDEDENYFLGGRLNLTSIFVGSQSAFSNADGYSGGVVYVGLQQSHQRPVTRIRREVVNLRLSGTIPDRKPPRTILGRNPATTLDWLTLLSKAENDPSVEAVVITIDDPDLGWARLNEMRRAIIRLREAGKFTICYLEGMVGNGEYYLATAADRIVIAPVSSLNFIGLRSEVTFVKRLLDKLGINADMEHIGDYKNASDLLTRTSMSPAHEEAVNRLLDDVDAQMRSDIASSRDVDRATVGEWIDHGPYLSVDAQSAGLVDRVAYADELDAFLYENRHPINAHVDGRTLAQRIYHRRQWGPQPKVAVVFAAGSIAEGNDGDDWLMGTVMGSQSVSKAIRRAREDHRVDAIVLRVNSGGGSVFASDMIWREVARTAGRKPIVVSFADVAASGGYYIATAADSIFALPQTVTGSIGIIHGKLDLSGLYEKVGLDRYVLERGRFASLYGSQSGFDDDERAVVRSQMTAGYERFVSIVAKGRRLTPDSVDAIGQGRVWSGTAAHELGLVDGYADLPGAIQTAARMAGIRPGQTVALEVLPKPGWSLFGPVESGLLFSSGIRSLTGAIGAVLGPTGIVPDGDYAFALPYAVTIE